MNDDQKNYWKPEDEQAPVEQSVQAAPEAPVAPVEAAPVEATQAAPAPQPTAEEAPVTWSAEEYVHIDKGGWWYVIFVVVALAMIAIDIFLLRAYTFSVLVVVMAVAIILYIRRPPRTLTYALSAKQGLYVGERLYKFQDYKAFGLIKDGEHNSIMLIPRKRFAPGVSVYFPEEAGERIVDILGQRLPMQELKLDLIDVLIRKLRL